jgi:hypothetical protein
LALYAVSRLVDAAFFVHAAHSQIAITRSTGVLHMEAATPASPGYFDVLTNWDGQWYWSIAEHGYPLPNELGQGRLGSSSFAFYPLFPLLARLGMRLTGFGFPVVAGLLSTVLGAGAVVLLHRFVSRVGSAPTARLVTAAVCFYPASPVLQTAYSESLGLLLVVTCVADLHAGRYARLAALLPALGLARGVGVPMSLTVLVVLAHRLRRPTGPRVRDLLPVLVAAGATPLLWPAAAGLLSGRWDAYLLATRDWYRAGSAGWLSASGGRWLLALGAVLALLVLLLLIALPSRHGWGGAVRTWSIAYTTYILVATLPAVHILRYLLLAMVPLVPLPRAGEMWPATSRGRAVALTAVCVVGAAAQWLWIARVFTISGDPAIQPYP